MLKLIETDASTFAAQVIASEALGFGIAPSQTGRLGREFAVAPEHAKVISDALRTAGFRTIVTTQK